MFAVWHGGLSFHGGLAGAIVAAYLFGSYAYGKPTNTSDIDLGFLCLSKQSVPIVAFSSNVSRALPEKEVDVVIADLTDKPLLLTEIIKGKLIYHLSTTV